MRPFALACCLASLAMIGCTDGEPTPAGLPGSIDVTGTVTFTRYPVTAAGIDYSAPEQVVAQGIAVELWDRDGGPTGDVSVTDSLGRYRLRAFGGGSRYRVVAVARQVRGGRTVAEVSDDIEPIYHGETLTTGNSDMTFDLHVPSGWNGSGYTASQRKAGAFAILETIRQVQALVLSAEPGLTFPELPIDWSRGATGSYYLPDAGTLFIGGLQDVDTDEYDQHVVAHEYAHFLLDTFTRDDSFGGAHDIDDLLDETVAFSEGVATAIGCMALGDPEYRDTIGAGQASLAFAGEGGLLDIEAGSGATGLTADLTTLDPGGVPTISRAGSYNELSVAAIMWDIYDDDGGSEAGFDAVADGFEPLWSALRGDVATTPAFTTVLALLAAFDGDAAVADIAANENVVATDAYEDASLGVVGPRYTVVPVDGGEVDTDAAGRGMFAHNEPDFAGSPSATLKLYDWQYLRFDGTDLPMYTITVRPSSGDTVISQGSGYYLSTDSGGSSTDDSVMLDHDGSAEVVFRVGANPTAIVETAIFTVEVTGPPPG